jgi:hypothetical protein
MLCCSACFLLLLPCVTLKLLTPRAHGVGVNTPPKRPWCGVNTKRASLSGVVPTDPSRRSHGVGVNTNLNIHHSSLPQKAPHTPSPPPRAPSSLFRKTPHPQAPVYLTLPPKNSPMLPPMDPPKDAQCTPPLASQLLVASHPKQLPSPGDTNCKKFPASLPQQALKPPPKPHSRVALQTPST